MRVKCLWLHVSLPNWNRRVQLALQLYNDMDIMLMGCSFAVPNYFGPPGVPPEYHTQYLLTNAGHRVHNCGKNAGSNMLSLNRAKSYLRGLDIGHPAFQNQLISPPDDLNVRLIIWFHTELSRDLFPAQESAKIIYKSFKDFFDTGRYMYIIVGGAGDLDPCWKDFFDPILCIPSWRREILGEHAPLSNTLWSKHGITDNDFLDTAGKIKLIDDDLCLRKLIEKSPDFPDGCHPGIRPHKDLTQQILKKLSSMT
jgi:hypothetical protein